MCRTYPMPGLLVAAMAILILQSFPLQAAEVTRGAMLSTSCAGCHGTDGRSPGSIPSISGKSAEFLEQTLKGFRSGGIPSTVMGRHIKGYTDEEIRLIAEYFASK